MSTGTPALDPTKFVNQAAPGRDCGTCTLCCKVYEVPTLAKPAGKWCNQCTPGKGCGIHETRPDHCRSFFCLWMTEGWLGADWKPERSKFVMSVDPVSRYMMVQVDPGHPKAWRDPFYYAQFQRWAQAMLPEERLVVVLNGNNATVVTPQGDVDLGPITLRDRIQLKLRITPTGPVYDILKSKVADA